MRLVHTLLYLYREDRAAEDSNMTAACLRSLEKSTYNTVVIYNQGTKSNDELMEELKAFRLDVHVIGDGVNVGTAMGRQKCFEYIWTHMPDTEFISEIHPDMILASRWEDALVNYLDSHDEPLISCGIVDQHGNMPFLNQRVSVDVARPDFDEFLAGLRTDQVVRGFTCPCIHVSPILKEIGGYNTDFLKGRQCFEDDSMLLGYYYYYGTKRAWYPKVNYNSVVYHAVAGQRLEVMDNVAVNLNGLIRQYGAMGVKALASIHESQWHKYFFTRKYNELIK